jgi:hypothetical protein
MAEGGNKMENDPRRMGAIRGPTTPLKPGGERKSIRGWLLAVGVPFGLIGLGAGLIAMGASTFMLGTWVAFAGIAWLLFDWWFFSKELSVATRLMGTLGTLVIGVIIGWVAFRPAPFTISFQRLTENYADGAEISGIKWSSKYSGLRMILRNDSDFQYMNLEFLIRTDVMIAAVGFDSKFSSCAAKPTLMGVEFNGPSIGLPDKYGKVVSTPLNFSIADVFKVVCDKLLPHDPVEIVLATRRRIVDGGFNEASGVTVRGSFEGFLKSRPFQKTECLIQGCTAPVIP